MREMSLLFPNGLSKALTLSYDDGVEQDIRLVGIMNKYGLKGTFNLSGGLFAPEGTVYPLGQIHRRMSKSAAYDLYANCGQEIALHAYTHPDLTLLSSGTAAYQIVKDREALEDMFGRIVRGMAYPYGTIAVFPTAAPLKPPAVSIFPATGCVCPAPATTTIPD